MRTKNQWETKEGVLLNIDEMGTSHIQNCIKFLTRTMPEHHEDEILVADHWSLPQVVRIVGARKYKAKIQEFKQELKKRDK